MDDEGGVQFAKLLLQEYYRQPRVIHARLRALDFRAWTRGALNAPSPAPKASPAPKPRRQAPPPWNDSVHVPRLFGEDPRPRSPSPSGNAPRHAPPHPSGPPPAPGPGADDACPPPPSEGPPGSSGGSPVHGAADGPLDCSGPAKPGGAARLGGALPADEGGTAPCWACRSTRPRGPGARAAAESDAAAAAEVVPSARESTPDPRAPSGAVATAGPVPATPNAGRHRRVSPGGRDGPSSGGKAKRSAVEPVGGCRAGRGAWGLRVRSRCPPGDPGRPPKSPSPTRRWAPLPKAHEGYALDFGEVLAQTSEDPGAGGGELLERAASLASVLLNNDGKSRAARGVGVPAPQREGERGAIEARMRGVAARAQRPAAAALARGGRASRARAATATDVERIDWEAARHEREKVWKAEVQAALRDDWIAGWAAGVAPEGPPVSAPLLLCTSAQEDDRGHDPGPSVVEALGREQRERERLERREQCARLQLTADRWWAVLADHRAVDERRLMAAADAASHALARTERARLLRERRRARRACERRERGLLREQDGWYEAEWGNRSHSQWVEL